ncbi:MAG: hypothetical protein DMF82_24105 [Acidobacteria bacterium]|nr:MAG: hypothetical protein DMF82_24105 [Acidobacteriota bacterium]
MLVTAAVIASRGTMSDEPKPLSSAEFDLLQSKNGVTGLSTVDVRRLLANNLRLRKLVLDAYLAIAERDPDFPRDVLERMRAEAELGR